jgi:flagellar biosynthesis protein FlhB
MEGKDGRTERATSKKRNEERQKGNVCISQEVNSMVVLVLGILSFRLAFPSVWENIFNVMFSVTRFEHLGDWTPALISQWTVGSLLFMGVLLAPLIIPVMIGAVVANMAQTKPFFSTKALQWKFSSLNPIKGFTRLFSAQAAVNLVLSVFKIGFIVIAVYMITRKQVMVFLSLANLPNDGVMLWFSSLVFRICITVAALFILIAVADWFYRHYKYEQGMMMTKQEVKDERRQEELNPLVKRKQYRKMLEFSMMRMIAAVPKASVVITNPTHVAVALQYDPDTMDAPKLTAKGLRLVAERIKKIARENNVPIVERPAMARSLYKHVKVGQFIPSAFYEAVAEVLAFLHRIGRGVKMAS